MFVDLRAYRWDQEEYSPVAGIEDGDEEQIWGWGAGKHPPYILCLVGIPN
ncbi:hypothetical protein A2U01_0013165 [Trifolium medium]|uniref:Uncharacterized protein n=1 Tax=Trifolium medium TaxID=97028 RepID=A0A392MZ91_9FABA|nr:hypothetical protein [Trifolium medium]